MTTFRFALGATVVLGIASGAALAAGDLSRQTPIEVTVDLGSPGKHEFAPKQIKFETGKLYKLILRNASNDPHYFTSHAFSQMVFTRKVQVTQQQNGKTVTLAEFKGAIREVEVYPGHSAEWWLVPVAAGRVNDLRCDIKTSDGKAHAELGMVGEIVIE
ncbi:hypothetical protein J6524_27795 [Bradyrhizobium sp. WSM 1738]|uniref:hypothetical protein n=1 Tax=Bradyrhizobium hereditatis TaxID=2821405 RepID=UPI001CE30952|nr:hypothetical protein [Bradyrhizobium hereditatis]MCA6118653.1 hypothetical protein [Bradyrhizobium hereditatis]